MPLSSEEIGFVPVGPEHYALLAAWMTEPHWREWWGEPEEELAYIREMVEGRDTSRPFLFTLAGEPVGYIQYWFVGHHQNEQWVKDHPWLMELPPETIGVDLSIGRPEQLSKGIGATVLRDFVAKLRREGYRSIIIDPDPNNLRAVRAYRKAGFRPIPRLEGRTGDVLIMQHNPTIEEAIV
jgi:aminoglycoside 6'-N-acetyltransferase